MTLLTTLSFLSSTLTPALCSVPSAVVVMCHGDFITATVSTSIFTHTFAGLSVAPSEAFRITLQSFEALLDLTLRFTLMFAHLEWT